MPPTSQEHDNSTLAHYSFIRWRLPAWLKNATPAQRASLRSALLKSHTSRILARDILTPLKSIETFAEPILELDIRARYPELPNMQVATLSKRWKKDSFLGIPIYDLSPEHTLLEAALYNFEAWETTSDAFGSGSALYRTGKAAGLISSLKPEVFARHCRNLDLGQKYHYHLKQMLDLSRPANEITIHESKRDYFLRHEQHRFSVVLLMAVLREDITDTCAARLQYFLSPLENSAANVPLYHQVKLLNHPLPGVIHFAADPEKSTERCAVYFPEHPNSPLQEYPSLRQFQEDCLEHLKSKDFRQLISQLMPIDHQGNLLTEKLRKTFSELPPTQDAHVNVISLSRIEDDLFANIHWRRLRRLESDIGRLATLSANANAAKREKLLEEYQDSRLDLLSTLKGFIPKLKRTLLRPPGIEIAATVYQDLVTWSTERMTAGWMHLLNVAEAAANGQVTDKMYAESAQLPRLIAVRSQGRTRLWRPDLTPYQLAVRLPDDYWQANSTGIYELGRETYLRLDQSYYRIKHDDSSNRWYIVMPGYPDLYSPPLQHNCVGAWRTIHEDVSQWSTAQLIGRLGPRAAKLPEPLANTALTLSGTSPHTLRQIHQYSRRTPPLLLDSLKRLWILWEIKNFDVDRAKGDITSELSIWIQAYLLTSLPGWPQDTALKILGNDSQVLIQYGDGETTLSVAEEDWASGNLLSVVLAGLSQEKRDHLLELDISLLGQLNHLALNLAIQATLKAPALLEHLYTVTEEPGATTATRQASRTAQELSGRCRLIPGNAGTERESAAVVAKGD